MPITFGSRSCRLWQPVGGCEVLRRADRSASRSSRRYANSQHASTWDPKSRFCAWFRAGLPFDPDFWSLLAGEVLLYAAVEIPDIQLVPDTLCCLLAHDRYQEEAGPRERLAPIQQAHYGSRDLVFGRRIYRPDYAGYNDVADVDRLADYLSGIDPQWWSTAALCDLRQAGDDEERSDELEFAREWFPVLRDLYQQASQRGFIVVSETLTGTREY